MKKIPIRISVFLFFLPLLFSTTVYAIGTWTPLAPSADSRLIYVSTSGNDTNAGLSPALPKRTIAAGKSLLRHGYPDWLLLRAGDQWDESFGRWVTSGRSAAEPLVVTSYGVGARPLLRTGVSNLIDTFNSADVPGTLDHVAFVGLHAIPHLYDGSGAYPPYGFRWLQPGEDLLIEDCLLEKYFTNVTIQGLGGMIHDFKLRRSVIIDAFTTGSGHAQGIYLSNVDGILVEENLIDHNGWSESLTGAEPTIFRHGAYIQNDTFRVTVRGNIFSRNASHGLQARTGGLIEDNFSYKNAIGLQFGGSWGVPGAAGSIFIARRNVVLEGRDISPTLQRGIALVVEKAIGGELTDNLVLKNTQGHFPVPLSFKDIANLTVACNLVYGWGGSAIFDGTVSNVTLAHNIVQNAVSADPLVQHMGNAGLGQLTSTQNIFHSLAPAAAWFNPGGSLAGWGAWIGDSGSVAQQLSFANPSWDLASFNTRLGGPPSADAFLAAARQQSRANWNRGLMAWAVNLYLRHGFTAQ